MENLIVAAEKLLNAIENVIAGARVKNGIIPTADFYRRRKITAAKQTETGVEVCGWKTEYFEKPNYHRAAELIFDQVSQLSEFDDFAVAMARAFVGKPKIEDTAEQVARRFVGNALVGKPYNPESACSLLNKELTGQPRLASSEIEVHGFALCVKNVKVEFGERSYFFRQLEQADLEREISQWELESSSAIRETPSSFLRIEMPANSPGNLQKESGRALVLLRLFKVGAVDFGKQSFETETLVDSMFGGIIRPRSVKQGSDNISLQSDEIEKFQKFWTAVLQVFPEGLNRYQREKTETFLRISYDRYCDSLFLQGPIEARIAFAVMALEALFLGGDNKSELSNRLSVRVAKLLTKLGFNGLGVQKRVLEAYRIRSIYVHGGHLKATEKANKEKKVGVTMDQLRLSILDYVRISFLIFIFGKLETDTQKDKLLRLLDDSLLDTTCDEELGKVVKNYSTICC